MIRALWFLVKLACLVAVLVWVADRPGTVQVDWMDYTFTIHMGLFLLLVAIGVMVAIFAYNTIKTFVDFPASFQRYREIKGREKGYEALTIGLAAVAAGDAKVAGKQAKRAAKFLQGDTGLSLLLRAQAARLNGHEEEALEHFAQLSADKNAAFLGVRGLLQSAMDVQNYDRAVELAEYAAELHPRQPWILRVTYDLYTRLRRWDEALAVLKRAAKAKGFSAEELKSAQRAIWIAKGDEAYADGDEKDALRAYDKAFKVDPAFSPSAVRLAKLYNALGERRKGVSVIKKAWKAEPHPDLAYVWRGLIPARQAGNDLARLKWFERLNGFKAGSIEGLIALGQAAMGAKLWGEARNYFTKALDVEKRVDIYESLIALERLSGHGGSIERWEEERMEAVPAPVWFCKEAGLGYERWSAIAEPHGAFNTIIWGVPELPVLAPLQISGGAGEKDVLDLPRT